MIELNHLERVAKMKVETANKRLASFQENFSKYPDYAFECGTEAYEAAAALKVWSKVLARQNDRAAPDESIVLTFAEIAEREAINGARWPKRSTSPSDCIMHQCMTAEWANMYCEITGRL